MKQKMYFNVRPQRHKFRLQVIGTIKCPRAGLKCVIVLMKCAVIFSRIVTDDAVHSAWHGTNRTAHHPPYYSWEKGIFLTHPSE